MRRRQALRVLAAAAAAMPALALAQRKTARIGLLWLGSPEVGHLRSALLERLRELGYAEGPDLAIEDRTGVERFEKLLEAAHGLVRLGVDVIVAYGLTAVRAARRATSALPVVMIGGFDPVKEGLAASLARPGGNVTGISTLTAELHGKQVQLLRETLPRARRVAALFNGASDPGAGFLRSVQAEGRRLGMEFHPIDVRRAEELQAAFGAAAEAKVDAVFIVPSTTFVALHGRIAQQALKHRVPCVGFAAEFAESGALLSYGINRGRVFRRAADYVDRILKGAAPAELPIEWPTEFELVVNLGTARALGVTIPPTVLIRATRTID